jgi:hypothetical protein
VKPSSIAGKIFLCEEEKAQVKRRKKKMQPYPQNVVIVSGPTLGEWSTRVFLSPLYVKIIDETII